MPVNQWAEEIIVILKKMKQNENIFFSQSVVNLNTENMSWRCVVSDFSFTFDLFYTRIHENLTSVLINQ